MDRMKSTSLIMIWIALSGTACSTSSVRIESEPPGARVVSGGKELGQTPLDLPSGSGTTADSGPFLNLELSLHGYEPLTVLLDSKGERKVNFQLTPHQAEFFEKRILPDFQEPMNQLVREVLTLQGLIFSRQLQTVEERLDRFVQKYPNIAAGYVLQANLRLMNKKKDEALRLLERARSIDPGDAVVARMIEGLKKREGP